MIIQSYLITCSRAALLAVPKRLLRRETPYPVALSPTCLTSWLVWFSKFWIQNGWNPVLNIDNPRQPWSEDDRGLRWTKWVSWSKEDLSRQFVRTRWSPDFKKDDKNFEDRWLKTRSCSPSPGRPCQHASKPHSSQTRGGRGWTSQRSCIKQTLNNSVLILQVLVLGYMIPWFWHCIGKI